MITHLRLKNVRLFHEEAIFRFLDITSLCGVNSSGKSTLLRTLMFLQQNQGFAALPYSDEGIVHFSGSSVDLGDYSSYVSANNLNSAFEIGIGLSINLSKPLLALINDVREIGYSKKGIWISTDDSDDISLQVDFHFMPMEVFTRNPVASTSRERMPEKKVKGFLSHATYSLIENNKVIMQWQIERDTQERESTYCLSMRRKFIELFVNSNILPLRDTGVNTKLPVAMNGILPTSVLNRSSQEEEKTWSMLPLPPIIDQANDALSTCLANIHYIGPLRAPAKRYYLKSDEFSSTLDSTGEFLPYLLSERDPLVTYVRPDDNRPIRMRLSSALSQWLLYIGTGDIEKRPRIKKQYSVSSTKGVLVQINIASPYTSDFFSLADSGFGYSQMLPILTRVLVASPRETIIVEQPEVHLNPSLQVRLSEFLMMQTYAGKRFILETHSEHMVNALRVYTAEQKLSRKKPQSNVYYFMYRDNIVHILDLSIRSDGSVPDWPYEFFGEARTLAGRLIRANIKPMEGT